MTEDALSIAWSAALGRLTADQSGPAGVIYARSAKPLGNIDGTILVAVPNDFTRMWIENKVMSELTSALSAELGHDVRIAVTIDSSLFGEADGATDDTEHAASDAPAPETSAPTEEPAPEVEDGALSRRHTDFVVDSKTMNLNPKYTFETFVIGPSNRFAHAAASAVAEGPGKTFNPLFIYGDSGLGKTHLLHAIGHYALQLAPHLNVRYVNSEEFTNDFINSIREDRVEEFQRRYRQVDILLIDDIQFIQGKEQTVEEFFHTFNTLYNANKQVVLTSDIPPKQLQGIEERLRSRFAAGLLVDIQPPDLETRIAILQKKAVGEQVAVEDEVLEYIASRISSNIRELEGSLLRVTAFAHLTQQKADLGLAELVLKNIISNPADNEVTMPLIMAQSADYFGVTIEQLSSSDRSRSLVEARQIAMYLCRELTSLSLPKIGAAFGGRDHTTVMYANKKITEQMASNPETFNHVTELTNRIKQAARNS